MNLHFNIVAENVAEFAYALGELAAKFGHDRTPHVAPAGEDVQSLLERANALLAPMGMRAEVLPFQTGAKVVSSSPGKVTATADVTPAQDPVTTDDLSGDAEDTGTDEDVHGEDKDPEDTADATDLAKAKEEALDLLRTVYARGAKGQKRIKELQAKYGVTKFVEVPTDRAAELLADAKAAIVAIPAKE